MKSLTVTTPGPHRDFQPPGIMLPPGSCDAHVHLFGPHERFPFAPQRTFTPEDVPLETLQEMHTVMGVARSVLVQSAAHGRDHSVLVDALRRAPEIYRAVALIDPQTPAGTVKQLDAEGFCGARIHFAPHLGHSPSTDDVRAIVDRIAPLNWHLEVHVMDEGIYEFSDMADQLDLTMVVDHMGRVNPDPVADDPRVAELGNLLSKENVWVKLSGADRISNLTPSMSDGLAFARKLFQSHPDRCVWGSDFPHPNTHGFVPWDHELVRGIAEIAPSAEDRARLLVHNPARLFGFGPLPA
ncbi:amidohydrolase family protein [Arthrobacter koreensis]|uniref:amidohydrolase family protein n=1 Tax=Arthrobacter koreensis TaxID=199136 RepID=UPI002DBAEE80|nr:amidohydrolase family protein [Arthrobacter koreensis]MEB7505498.1 amidohydrolase family protein [Arthrobacter koreensis]